MQAASFALSVGFVQQMLPHDDSEGEAEGKVAGDEAMASEGKRNAASPVQESSAAAFMGESDAMDVVTALYDFTPGDDATEPELAFKTGDVITVTAKDDAGWWTGELNGASGLFPANYTSGGQ